MTEPKENREWYITFNDQWLDGIPMYGLLNIGSQVNGRCWNLASEPRPNPGVILRCVYSGSRQYR